MTMQKVSLESSVATCEDVVCREVDGELVILNLETGIYYGLDPVGTRIWQLMKEHGSLQLVFERLLEEYDVSAEVLEADLLQLTEQLQEKGIWSVTAVEG
jgi:hypothetical protein